MLWLVTNISEERFQGFRGCQPRIWVLRLMILDCSCVQDARVCLLALSGYRRMLDRQPCVFLLEVWSQHSPIRFIELHLFFMI